jgi:hypothetical protein
MSKLLEAVKTSHDESAAKEASKAEQVEDGPLHTVSNHAEAKHRLRDAGHYLQSSSPEHTLPSAIF